MQESLTAAERVALARHALRPGMSEYIAGLFTYFFEMRGDRLAGEDAAILGGVARYHGMPVTVIGTRKGHSMEENLRCRYGMPGPEGYRKALRLMKQAEKFARPVITFIDTPGAFPGVSAEERGQGEACELMTLTAPELLQMGVIDGVIPEPEGGARQDEQTQMALIDRALSRELEALCPLSGRELAKQRMEEFRHIGQVRPEVRG